MPDERLPKRLLSGHMDGSGVRGRSQKQHIWVDYVREALQFAGLSFTLLLHGWQTVRLGPYMWESGSLTTGPAQPPCNH